MRRTDRVGHLLIAAALVVVLGATTFVVHRQTDDRVMISYWWFGMLVILFCVFAFVIGRRYLQNEPAPGRVVCIVPTYEEPTEHLHACIEAILAQDWPVDVHVIDDGSKQPAEEYHHPRVIWHRQANKGKRGAQVTVLRWIQEHLGADYYSYALTVDSDSRPYPNALRELLKAMNQDYDPSTGERRIWASTGMIYIRNYDESWVSRAADMDIGASCVMMRASRSMLGALETTSGALALYPTELLYDHLDEYEVECGTGDDRWLALRALMRGEVVAVQEAAVETEMPTDIRSTRKQRLRWARSWWWMLPFVFRDLSPKQLISPLYGITQLIVAPLVLLWAVVGFIMSAGHKYESAYGVLFMYVGAYFAVRFGLSGFYLLGRPNMPAKEKWKSFTLGTLQAIVLNMVVLMPLRYWALTQLNNAQWDNRGAVTAPRHLRQRFAFRNWNPRYLLAGAVLFVSVSISAYAMTGGEQGPAQFVTQPGNAALFDDEEVFAPPRSSPTPKPSPTATPVRTPEATRTAQTTRPTPRATRTTVRPSPTIPRLPTRTPTRTPTIPTQPTTPTPTVTPSPSASPSPSPSPTPTPESTIEIPIVVEALPSESTD